MKELQILARYAAQNNIRGSSNKRNSLLKPLDTILQELDRCPDTKNENELELVKAGCKGLIFEHIKRIADAEYKPGRTKEAKVYKYVDLFFDEVLAKAHHKDANKLLQRERLIRSAYLVYYRQAIAEKSVELGKAKNIEEGIDTQETSADVEEEGV